MSGREMVVKSYGSNLCRNTFDIREIAARTTLREVRQKGHSYVELRRAGKRHIFFCTLCLTPCFSDSVLFDHLRGNLHTRRFAAAKVTLLDPLPPWPFNDGVLFFNNSVERDDHLFLPSTGLSYDKSLAVAISNGNGSSVASGEEVTSKFKGNSGSNVSHNNHNAGNGHVGNGGCGAIVPYRNARTSNDKLSLVKNGINGHNCAHGGDLEVVSNGSGCICSSILATNGGNQFNSHLMIPEVLIKDEVADLKVQFVGSGQIGLRVYELDGAHGKISRIWCAWLGDENTDDNDGSHELPRCDFAVVVFSYTYDLGRKVVVEDMSTLLLPGCFSDNDIDSPRSKRKRSSPEHEKSDESHMYRCDLGGEDGPAVSDSTGNGACSLQSLNIVSSRDARRALRQQKRLAAEKICDICSQPMLPGKDVATLLNLKTGNLACSSRNTNGAFHLFHASCLIHWILLCESETWGQSSRRKTVRRSRGKVCVKRSASRLISSVFCPECQGTGMKMQGDELESPTISLSEMFLYKLKTIEAHKAWMKDPEVLHKCSTGLHLQPHSSENSQVQEKVIHQKLLNFYRAEEWDLPVFRDQMLS